MNKSKAMKALIANLTALQTDAQALQTKPDATAAEITAKTEEIKAVKAKIKAQEILDESKEFDEAGELIPDTKPVNDPIYAQPKNHKGPFNSFGEQLLAVVKSSPKGAVIDKRLMEIQNASGANEGVPSEGGFLVQQDFVSEIQKVIFDQSQILSMCREIPISANSNGVKLNGIDETNRANGSRWGGVQGYWANEAATVTSSKPKFRKIELSLNKLFALYYSTDELLADASAMEAVLSQAFSEELSFKALDAIIRGTGAGQPLGILNAGCLVSQAKETGQAADTVVHENISKMWNRLFAGSRANAAWLVNQEVEPQLEAMALAIGTGGTLSPMAMEYMTKGTIKGRPVIPIEQASALGDVGDIILADMRQYLLATKGGPQMASSMHVQFLYDEMTFRMTWRLDGQPALHSAITPYKGASTLSSFVTLAERA
ncbi:phage major capsid protein [Papillibacter cinnamivorans]|uniref:Phage major capsid protein, HK97 family n=1 Tax=Papillibacter cinnamivorans DSM 12816 TaxID=1122930 RepID=A0A1W1YQT5_9FIRM|nr:phage major capsid protein [Papillibacter cinnamivorans]SMC38496.1 phage major capsid protein, HK97 family [Papillibacter cinnamivorans DSM 12816]